MATEIHFSDDELSQLHLFLSQELAGSRVELDHTAMRAYREYVKERIELEKALLKKVTDALPREQLQAADNE